MSGETERNAGVFVSRPVVAGFLGSARANLQTFSRVQMSGLGLAMSRSVLA